MLEKELSTVNDELTLSLEEKKSKNRKKRKMTSGKRVAPLVLLLAETKNWLGSTIRF